MSSKQGIVHTMLLRHPTVALGCLTNVAEISILGSRTPPVGDSPSDFQRRPWEDVGNAFLYSFGFALFRPLSGQ
jgi:hypothetical protein